VGDFQKPPGKYLNEPVSPSGPDGLLPGRKIPCDEPRIGMGQEADQLLMSWDLEGSVAALRLVDAPDRVADVQGWA